MPSYPFKVGDIITRNGKYFGLIVTERYCYPHMVYLTVLNTSNHVRQLNLLYSESNNYAYEVVSV